MEFIFAGCKLFSIWQTVRMKSRPERKESGLRESENEFLNNHHNYAGDAVLLCIDGVLIHIPSNGIFLAGLFGGYRLTRE